MTIKQQILDFFANNPGTHETSEVAKAIGKSVKSASPVLSELAREGRITKIQRGLYRGNDEDVSTSAPVQFADQRKQMSKHLRTAEDNEATISKLLNLYDDVLDFYIAWIALNLNSETDFEQQLLFIENFKWLTAIADKLMKRWALVHIGYDTNTRQAQEDAKAKAEERQKAALKDAPIEEQVSVIGSFDLETKELIDNFPTLENLTDEEAEEIKV